jgi:hypothetical protein
VTEEPRRLYLVAGGTPAARVLAKAFDDPEVRARLEEALAELARHARVAVEQVAEAFARAAEAYRPLLDLQLGPIRQRLVDAGVIPNPGPEDPRERALWVRQHRGTGPDRPAGQRAHRPRRIP